jgi:hypothetical protein
MQGKVRTGQKHQTNIDDIKLTENNTSLYKLLKIHKSCTHCFTIKCEIKCSNKHKSNEQASSVNRITNE